MTKLETNALRIAELMGCNIFHDDTPHSVQLLVKENIYADYEETISDFSSYNGLMDIVFECNRGDSAIKLKKHFVEFWYLGDNETSHYNDYRSNYIITKPEFIEAIQLAVIKYLELRNEK